MNPNKIYTYNNLKNIASKYKTLKEFYINEKSAYYSAVQQKILPFITSDLIREREQWTSEKVIKLAKQYKNRTKFHREQHGAWLFSKRNGILSIVTSHMKPKWTLELCIKEAKKHVSIKEWKLSNEASYKQAYRKGWLAECKKVMKKYS